MLNYTVTCLRRFPDQLAQQFMSIPAAYQTWRPQSWEGIPSESMTAIEQLCHLRDVEIDGYHQRFKRLLMESSPTLESLDGYALIEEREYHNADPVQVINSFRQAREKTVRLIQSLTPLQMDRRGYIPGYGEICVRSLIHFLSSHDQQHLSGLQWLLGQLSASEASIHADEVDGHIAIQLND